MAKLTLAEAMRLESRAFEPLQAMAETAYMLCGLGDLRRAGQVIAAILLIAPKDPCTHLLHARLLLMQGHSLKAIDAAKLASRLAGSDSVTLASALNLRGRAALQAKRLVDAERAWNDAKLVDPDGPAGREAVGLLRNLRYKPPVKSSLIRRTSIVE